MNEMRKLMEAMEEGMLDEHDEDVLAATAEIKVVRDGDMVHIIDGEDVIRISMFSDEWEELLRSSRS